MPFSTLRKTVIGKPHDAATDWGHLFLRVSAGLMIFYIHGWHKLEGWLAYQKDGTPWKLAEEVAAMHFPVPIAVALAATSVQFVCSLFLIVGCLTRVNSALLVGVLGVAIIQNLLASRDPQLAILYTLVVLALAMMGGGRFSVDAWLIRNHAQPTLKES